MKKLIFAVLVFLIGAPGFSQHEDPQYKDPQNMKIKPANTDCQDLPTSFKDLEDALMVIENMRFYYDQKIKTTRRRGLMQARYLSCDFKTGFLVIRYDNDDQIYPDIAIKLWKEFQQTADIDGFYFDRIEKLPLLFIHE